LGLFIGPTPGRSCHTFILLEHSDGERPLLSIRIELLKGSSGYEVLERHLIVRQECGWLDPDRSREQEELVQSDVLIPTLDVGNRRASQSDALGDLTLR